jgi:BirA family transcriptional regulator, biotin operon repressor / biotin---[acetyl-CoA-carboxylase] ligase
VNLPGIAQVLRLNETTSTQTVARCLAQQGAPDRTLIWAETQTAGRGRMRRAWSSGPGGLYFSIILRPDIPPSRLTDINLAAAKAAAKALSELGISTTIKLPNDVLGRRGQRAGKICGILAEACGNSRQVEWVLLGGGINVNNPLRGFKTAASLKSLTGHDWDTAYVLKLFLATFFADYLKS